MSDDLVMLLVFLAIGGYCGWALRRHFGTESIVPYGLGIVIGIAFGRMIGLGF